MGPPWVNELRRKTFDMPSTAQNRRNDKVLAKVYLNSLYLVSSAGPFDLCETHRKEIKSFIAVDDSSPMHQEV